jgi:hypothetical protein
MSTQTNSLTTLQEADLEKYGFPKGYSQAFLDVAKNNNCVVMTREPGEACTMLLAEDYDAKGFFIKAKSCNWGAMAGFVCLDPILNKNAFDGAWGNLTSNLHSLKDFYEDDKTAESQRVFISQERLNWLINNNKITGNYSGESKQFYSCASTNNGLTINFLLVKDDNKNQWALFYDLLAIYQSSSIKDLEKMGTYFKSKIPPIKDEKERENFQKIFEEYWNLINKREYLKTFADYYPQVQGLTIEGKTFAKYYPVMAMTNPHRSFSGDLAYLNAVTGDFDLYAVWPQSPNEDDDRIVGMDVAMTDGYIEDVEKKKSIDFGNKSIKFAKLVGNISQRVFNIAQEINSLIPHKYPSQCPNRVFHSDEAGRPFVNEVDSAIAFTPEGNIFKIANAQDLGSAIEKYHELGYACYVNKGWKEPLQKIFTDSILQKLKWAKSI